MYKQIKNPKTDEVCAISIIGTSISFPINEENRDYQEYLKWLAEGNEPEPADEE